MKVPALRYELLADDKTAKGLNAAKKNVGGFEKGIESLGKKLAAVFAADKIIAFGKASIKAFEEDQKSAAMLANTLKNLGMQFATPVLEGYIANLSKTAAVADDELRPAMQKLLTQTGNYAKSQEILNQAIEVSRGSGVELATVTQDLANAYVGNTKGLKKYNLGLTQAELKTMSFVDIQKKLNAQFKGANAAYLKTYAGQMQTLKVAAGEAQETIGKGLLDSLSLLASDGSVQGLADAMQSFADFTSNSIYAVGSLASELKNLKAAAPSWLNKIFSITSNVGPLGQIKQGINGLKAIANYGERQRNKTLQNPSVQMFMTDQANQRLNNQKIKTAKEQVKATKALTAEQKKQAALKKAGTVFDLEQIQLVAALQGKLSEQDRLRAEAQLALLNGNDAVATKLTKEILASQDATGNLAKLLTSLPDANNPFKYLDAYLDGLKLKVNSIFPGGVVLDNGMPKLDTGNTQVMPQTNAQDYSGFALNTNLPGTSGSGAQFGSSTPWAQAVQVVIDGKTIASALLDQSLSGNQAYVDRRTGGFNW